MPTTVSERLGNLTSLSAKGGEAPVRRNGSSGSPALECRGLSKRFGGAQAVQGLDLSVDQGRVLAIVGPSGCGKTTALRLIAGFEQPDAGTVALQGRVVGRAGNGLPPEKRRVGMVFQEGALFPHLTVEQNIAYGLPRAGRRKGRMEEVLELTGLAGLRDRMPYELSGGQQQRVALGRALAPGPEVLLLDEPFSNLDPNLRDRVRRDVLDIVRASQSTTVFVTHDQEEALFLGDSIAVMNQGRVEQEGSPEEIFHNPQTRFVAQFIGLVEFLPAWSVDGVLTTEVGPVSWPSSLNNPVGGQSGRDGGVTALELMVRPDCLECRPSDEGQGVVVDREFRGAFYLYRVALPSGRSVRCLLPHTAEYPLSSKVEVSLRQGHKVRPFRDQLSVVG